MINCAQESAQPDLARKSAASSLALLPALDLLALLPLPPPAHSLPTLSSNQGVASCAGIRAAVGTKPTKVIARGHVGPSDIATLSRHHDGIESPPPFRLMVWVAKNGLGNTIRGFLSTFFYAFLSGRQLVRSPEGSHGKVSPPAWLACPDAVTPLDRIKHCTGVVVPYRVVRH